MDIKLIAAISHDNKERKPGDVLKDVAEATAQRLIDMKFAVACDGDTPDDDDTPDDGEDGTEGNGTHDAATPDDLNTIDPAAEVNTVRDIDKMSKDDLAQELSLLGIGFKSNDSLGHLKKLYREFVSKKE